MNHKSRKLCLAFLFGISLSAMQAQVMIVQDNAGTKTTDSLKNVRKLSFPAGQVTVTKFVGAPTNYALSSIRYIENKPASTFMVKTPNWNLLTSPNPVLNSLKVQLLMAGVQPIVVEVLSLDGKTIYYTGPITGKAAVTTIDVTAILPGTYMCKAYNGIKIEATKFVKK